MFSNYTHIINIVNLIKFKFSKVKFLRRKRKNVRDLNSNWSLIVPLSVDLDLYRTFQAFPLQNISKPRYEQVVTEMRGHLNSSGKISEAFTQPYLDEFSSNTVCVRRRPRIHETLFSIQYVVLDDFSSEMIFCWISSSSTVQLTSRLINNKG